MRWIFDGIHARHQRSAHGEFLDNSLRDFAFRVSATDEQQYEKHE